MLRVEECAPLDFHKIDLSLDEGKKLKDDVETTTAEMGVSLHSRRGSMAATAVQPLPEFSNQKYDLGGQFTFEDSLESLIGLGAFGVVYKGHDRTNNKSVAVKKMMRVHVKENELKLIRSLQSDFLVGVLNICNLDEQHCCLVMELCDTDLDFHIKNNAVDHRLNAVNLRTIVDNIARGYKALFELKIVHRDIKPQNILISYNPNSRLISSARITDFGISRTLEEDDDGLSNVAGTLFYMAPEIGANLVKTCQYDAKVDMWSIGCLLYQCVTGEIPFDECSLCKLFLYTAGSNFEAYDPPELPDDTNEEVAAIIYSLLEIDCSRRCAPIEYYNRALTYSQKIY